MVDDISFSRGGKMEKAPITGVTGQDRSCLAEFLLLKRCEVHGIMRRASTLNIFRIDHIYKDFHRAGARHFACREAAMIPCEDGVRVQAEADD